MWKLIRWKSQTFQGKHQQESTKFRAANTTGNLICLPPFLLAWSEEMVISSLRLCSQILDIFKILFHLTRKNMTLFLMIPTEQNIVISRSVLALRLMKAAWAADKAEHLLYKQSLWMKVERIRDNQIKRCSFVNSAALGMNCSFSKPSFWHHAHLKHEHIWRERSKHTCPDW